MTQEKLHRPAGAPDLLRWPPLRWFARRRYGRLALQGPFLFIAFLLVYDGFTGPQKAAENLATVVPWVHYRGVIVLILLLAGNLFCMGCPFTLPRTLARRLSLRGRRFPRMLRNKWLAIIALLLMFFAYEYLDMWAGPRLTAWVIVAYFVASFVLEAVFSESAFCKYVCPLGTFNFVYATTAPTQISVHDHEVCRSCVGKECVNGSYAVEAVIRMDQILVVGGGTVEKKVKHSPQGTLGCGTQLFPPQMTSNLDCTLCLDCVRACPHDNVGLFLRPPGQELVTRDAWPKRWDIAFLVVALLCLGLVNAFGMVPPVYDLMQDMAHTLGLTTAGWHDETIEFVVLGIIFLGGGVLLPMMILLGGATLTRLLTNTTGQYTLRQTASHFAPAFVPLGLGVWTAHYGFHFLIGAFTIIPVLQNFLLDHRISWLGSEPDWTLGGIGDEGVISVIQLVALIGGFLWSLWIGQQKALQIYRRKALPALLPWALILLALMAAAAWIFSLDMEMRGTILFS